MMKQIAIEFKPIDYKSQPIDAIGCKKAEPIAPIDNLLTGLRAIGLKRKYSKYIYIYKKQQPIDVFTPTPSREIYMALFSRTRVCKRNSAMGLVETREPISKMVMVQTKKKDDLL